MMPACGVALHRRVAGEMDDLAANGEEILAGIQRVLAPAANQRATTARSSSVISVRLAMGM